MHPLLDVGGVPHGVDFVAPLLDVQVDCSTRCVTAGGELDCASVGLLATFMTELLVTAPGDSSVDIANLTFIDASGLGCLVHCRNQLAAVGAEFSVAGATSRQRRLFEIVGLSALLAAS
jgi:anti-anti-sigma factor